MSDKKEKSLVVQPEKEMVLADKDKDIPAANDTAKPSINAGIRFKVLNTSLSASYEHSAEGAGEQAVTKTKVLILPTEAPNGGMSIAEMVAAVNAMIEKFSGKTSTLTAEDITEKMAGLGLGDIAAIQVELRQVFLYIIHEKKGSGEPVKTMEYALSIRITTPVSPDPSLKALFDIESVQFSLWNTTRDKILARMQLGDIDKLLEMDI